MSRKVSPILLKYRHAFCAQRYIAGLRGIAFHFSFEEWCQWWESNLGPDWFKKRGRQMGQYVMGRNTLDVSIVKRPVQCVVFQQSGCFLRCQQDHPWIFPAGTYAIHL